MSETAPPNAPLNDGRAPPPPPPRSRPIIVKTAVMAYDLAAAWLAMFLAVELRYRIEPDLVYPDDMSRFAASMFLLACAIVFPLQRLHRGVWRFTALNDVFRILNAVALANLLFLFAMFFFNRLDGMPRTSLLIEGPFLAALLVGARLIRQTAASGDWRSVIQLEDRTKPAALLAGGDASLDAFLRDAGRRKSGAPFRVRGLIEPNAAERGRSIRGVPVLGGPEQAERALISLSGNGVRPQLVLVDPSLPRDTVEAFANAAYSAGAQFVRVTGDQNAKGTQISELNAADLLSRPPRDLDMARARWLVTGKRVLVTGAGGTIGSELTRQIAQLDPAELVLVDASELNLYEIDLELRDAGVSELIRPKLGDVRDITRMRDIIMRARPHVVLHAAALKHVPLMEQNPTEAVLTNVWGTMVVAEVARDAGADSFVLISTDKAVNPTNVMGASKRAAEMFVQALDAERGAMRAVSVRFGNVLGSTGSVVPLFERQIARGGPITVTHKDITRYFMTTSEAAALVLQAAAGASVMEPGGGVFVLDMGEPVRIDHLARTLCRLRGHTPDEDIAIIYTGLRPGEKVHEALFYDDETVRETGADGVFTADAPLFPMGQLKPRLDEVVTMARERDRDGLLNALQSLAPEFHGARTLERL